MIQAPSKRGFFLPFSKKSTSTCSVFKSFLPVHTYPDIYENGGYFSPFSKKSASTSFLPVQDFWCHRFRKPPFSSVNTAPKNTRLKNLQFGEPFEKAPVSVTKNTVYVRVDGSRIRIKKAPFQKYPDTCGRPGPSRKIRQVDHNCSQSFKEFQRCFGEYRTKCLRRVVQ